MSISTGTGDSGFTSLWTGQRVRKTCKRVEAYGTVDELNSHLGEAKHYVNHTFIKEAILGIQKELSDISGQLATVGREYFSPVSENHVKRVSALIDHIQEEVSLKGFVVPGATLVSSKLDIARTVARRTERRLFSLAENEEVPELILIYMNRLSDLLYMMARYEEQHSRND
ncbi:MAG TPA: cob(I)yrinic acid a,c-diamide adenosyltransferase [Kosmotogaceae bacterium]|nr:MAG: ATP:cob(I)alamin adenosyltransferase [Thermotogales bacterium 46_20]HAA85681.1 cob(I)yrinic acid a,c-diamide adenosyltransferase [Kosmotogaceae bacterium]